MPDSRDSLGKSLEACRHVAGMCRDEAVGEGALG